MRNFPSIAAFFGEGLRPELRELFDRIAIDPHTELFVRPDGMTQSGPDPVCKAVGITQKTPEKMRDPS
jgi:hypothetical protein